MRVIPAIDLKDGKCVRLFQGDYAQQTEYANDPLLIARRFAEFNVGDLHVVDLDGARTGAQANAAAIRKIAAETPFDVQVGGGIRDSKVLDHWLANGVSRAVIGSLAVSEPETIKTWLNELGGSKIVLALDVTIADDGTPYVSTNGWTSTSQTTLWNCIERYLENGLQHVLCTDISRDGAMAGPNIDLYRRVLTRYPELQLQASGGVRHAQDLETLAQLGVPAAITGRALLDGKISAAEVASFRRSA